MPDGTERPSGAIGVRSTPRAGDVAGTHNRLRSHGYDRCLVISRTPSARPTPDTYRGRLGSVETRDANRTETRTPVLEQRLSLVSSWSDKWLLYSSFFVVEIAWDCPTVYVNLRLPPYNVRKGHLGRL